MQAVIIAGGLATRLNNLSKDKPKSMIEILGKPFVQYQLEILSDAGIRDIVFCIGHLGQQIEQFVGDGSRFNLNVNYSFDGEVLLGTGGALKKAEILLQDTFLIMWGDSYLMLDYQDIEHEYRRRKLPAMMVVYKNDNERDRSNVILSGDIVAKYDKWNPPPETDYIDNGLTVCSKSLLPLIPSGEPYAIERLFAKLASESKLGAYITAQRFYEIGSLNGIAEFEQMLNENLSRKGQQ